MHCADCRTTKVTGIMAALSVLNCLAQLRIALLQENDPVRNQRVAPCSTYARKVLPICHAGITSVQQRPKIRITNCETLQSIHTQIVGKDGDDAHQED